jgi:hypothetical protein
MLLADLHVHTTWSDGRLSMSEVVDLFGRSGHDVIAITDHVVNSDNVIGKVTHRFGLSVTKENFDAYRSEIDRQARRAWDEYRMVVLSGVELTQNRFRRNQSAHALALGVDDFISAEGTVEEMLTRANDADAVVIACHPNEQSDFWANTFISGIAARKYRGSFIYGRSPADGISFHRWRAHDFHLSATAIFTIVRIYTRGRRCCRARKTPRM